MSTQHSDVTRATCVGGGVIGAGWAARLRWHGIDVTVADPNIEAERRGRETWANAERALTRLWGAPPSSIGELHFTGDLAGALDDADLILESAPENLALKRELLRDIDRYAPAHALICSSTSGLRPTALQSDMAHPERFLVAHPFNPVYLLPLVEICGGESTNPAAMDRAAALFRRLGMFPLHVRREIDGFIADRLLEALWREALWLVNDDIATVMEIDDAIRYGAGLRWAMMGSFMTYRIAGGEAGMRHFMGQFGPALQWPWTKLTDVPDLTDDLIDKIAAQSDDQADGRELRELERRRDDGLVAILQALQPLGIGAGAIPATEQPAATSTPKNIDLSAAAPLTLLKVPVQPTWIDYNGHMTEHRYLHVFGEAADALFATLGMDAAYLEGGRSFFTVESHLRHLAEAGVGDALLVTTQLLGHDAKRMHAFHRLWRTADDRLLATAEQMYVHVDTTEGGATAIADPIASRLQTLAAAHAALDPPDGMGRVLSLAPRAATEPMAMRDSASDTHAPIPDFCSYPVTHTITAAAAWQSGAEATWSDGHVSRFHGLWLRDNCPCPACVNPATREQVFDISTVDSDLTPIAVAVDRTGALSVVWPDGHESRFHPGWLRAHCSDLPEKREFPATAWGGDFHIPKFDGTAVLRDDDALLAWLESLTLSGVSIVENCPLKLGAVEWFAKRIGFLRETNFGRVFDVRSKPDPDSNAYTALELPLHVDLPTRELQPGLQFLLCRVNEAAGGDSILADGFRIVESLRVEAPEHFETLTTLPMEFRNRSRISDYRMRLPAIRLDEAGDVAEIRLGNFLRGPLKAAPDHIPRIYAAYRHFVAMTREDRFRLRFRLHPGDMAAFDNRRVLHARTAFDPATGARHLQGCYVDTDEMRSRLRVLRRRFGEATRAREPGDRPASGTDEAARKPRRRA